MQHTNLTIAGRQTVQYEPQKLFELCTRPHVLSRQFIWTVWSQWKILLNRVVRQVNRSAVDTYKSQKWSNA